MKKALSFFVLIFLVSTILAQDYVNPFDSDRNEFNQRDMITLVERNGSTVQDLFVYDWTTALGNQAANFSAIYPMGDDPLGNSTQDLIPGQERMIIETGNFNNNLKDDVFYLFEHSGTFHYGAAEQTVYWDSLSNSFNVAQEIPELLSGGDVGTITSFPCVTIGDFDGDGTEEAAIAFTEEFEDLVFIQIVKPEFSGTDFDVTIPILQNTNIPCEKINGFNGINRSALSISSGDLNGDGTDEIVIGGMVFNSGEQYDSYVQIYDVETDGTYNLITKGYQVYNNTLIDAPEDPDWGPVIYARTGVSGIRPYNTLEEGGTEDIFASVGIYRNTEGGTMPTYNYLNAHALSVSEDLETITVGDPVVVDNSTSSLPDLGSFEVKVGDVSNDNQDDVVVLTDSYVVYTYEEGELVLKYDNGAGPFITAENNPVQESTDRFDIGDIDRDGFDDLVSFSRSFNGTEATYYTEAFQMVLEVNESEFGMDPNSPWTIVKTGEFSETYEEGNSLTYYAFDMGNLDGNDLHLGEPTIFECDYAKPNVIIESIPHHFDYFEGNELAVLGPQWADEHVLDVNDCWGGGCSNRVSYLQANESGETNSNTYTSAWSVSATASVAAPTGPIGMNASMTYQYGEQFSKTYSEANSASVNVTDIALVDDKINYHGYPIQMYEYPILSAEDEIVSYIWAAFPAEPGEQDSDASKDLENYLPNHEIGNVLSYPYEPNPGSDVDFFYDANTNLVDPRIWVSQSIDVTEGVGTELTLSFQEEIVTEESTQTEQSMSVSVGVSGFGLGGEVTGSYSETNLDVFGQSISTLDSYTFTPGALADGLASNDFKYEFRTVMYWNYMNGAKIGMQVASLDGTRWEEIYGQKVDPALNLPWRLDYLKFTTEQEANKERTKSMRFDKLNPQPQDTVTVYTRLFNYSTLNMSEPVDYILYAGDPENGGQVIESLDGTTLHSTLEAMSRQDQIEDSVSFVVTLDMLADAENRIYIVVDPNNEFDETHEDNNVGWTNLGFACNLIDIETGLDEVLISQDRISVQAYPNPTNGDINFSFEESLAYLNENLFIRITDLSGRIVIDSSLNNGANGQYNYNVSSLTPGVYVYQIYTPKEMLFSERFVKREGK